MEPPSLTISMLPGSLAICRLESAADVPVWADGEGFSSVTRTADELSVVCLEAYVPEGVEAEAGWRALKVHGPLDFSLTGVLASLASALARAGIPVFALSTFDTDYLLVKAEDLDGAVDALEAVADVRA